MTTLNTTPFSFWRSLLWYIYSAPGPWKPVACFSRVLSVLLVIVPTFTGAKPSIIFTISELKWLIYSLTFDFESLFRFHRVLVVFLMVTLYGCWVLIIGPKVVGWWREKRQLLIKTFVWILCCLVWNIFCEDWGISPTWGRRVRKIRAVGKLLLKWLRETALPAGRTGE